MELVLQILGSESPQAFVRLLPPLVFAAAADR
jgi:hypothetical protein